MLQVKLLSVVSVSNNSNSKELMDSHHCGQNNTNKGYYGLGEVDTDSYEMVLSEF